MFLLSWTTWLALQRCSQNCCGFLYGVSSGEDSLRWSTSLVVELYSDTPASLALCVSKGIIKRYNFCEIKLVLRGANYEIDFTSSRKLENKHLILSN